MKELVKPYILYVGNNYPHKNLERLKLACEKIRQDGLKYSLILITGFISEQKLDDLYKNASLFVFPSLYEGFGLPPLEAMKRGLPVVSSNASCMPEILGDAVLYFDPLNLDDMTEKIKNALRDRELREELTKKGLEQIKKYSWPKMAQETLLIYKKIIQYQL
jgi:glycosyltransferase involved in cell wall biosynthesis